MKANIRNIYQFKAYMQIHRILYLMMLVKAVTSSKDKYDANNNRNLLDTTTHPDTTTGTTTYTYDSRNRLKTAVVDGLITTYVYYPDGKKNTVTYPNGTYVKYTYHPSNRIDTVANKLTFDGSVFSSYTYTYDLNGNRKTQVELQEGVTETTTYNYDRIDRMTDFTVTDSTNTTLSEYTFEGYNRKTETVTENSTVTKSRTYNYDETDWLISIADSVQQSAISYSYDNNGNTILKSDSSLIDQDVTFIYDSRNQLVETKRGPPESEVVLGQYDYNSNGLRVRHRLSERGDVDYYYDDNAVIEEHNAGDDSLLAHYRYGDRLLTLNSVLGTQYYHHDAVGSTVNLTTETASVQVSYKLDPWGHIKSQTGTSVNRQIFTGQEHDENTGLIYFGARYYDPDTARFITQNSYLGEQNTPPSFLAEVIYHGGKSTHVIRYELDLNNVRVLDLTDPAISSKWGYLQGNDYAVTQVIAKKAKSVGFNTIKYKSLRGSGANFAVLDDFDSILKPKMVVPVP